MTTEEAAAPAWWQEAVFYQIYPRSYCLGDQGERRDGRPGAGNLEGIRRRLDHLEWLGVDALWISPFQPSPMADFGYDVADYCDVDPLFGTLGDFDRLLADVHGRGMRCIVDWVPNHTSDRHPWFVESRSGRDAGRRSWYVWRDGRGNGGEIPPNNWIRSFGPGPAWTRDEVSGQWYLHLFLPEQPDLDWSNADVRAAMEAVLDFWLDRGVDGFRIDVVHALGKDPAFPDAPEDRATIPWSAQNDHPSTHDIVRRIRDLLDARPHQPVAVGEVFLLDTAKVATYAGPGQLHLAFDFVPMYSRFEARSFRRRILDAERLVAEHGGWPTWVLSSHDRPRHRTRFGSERAARAAAVMLLTLRGTPFLYAGEELGLADAVIPDGRALDPGGRDGCRAPIPWDGSPDHGWQLDGAEPWLPWPPEAATRNQASLLADPGSILHLYRRLLVVRRSTPALRRGAIELFDTAPDVLGYLRRDPAGDVTVLVNFAAEERPTGAAAGLDVLVSSGGEAARQRDGEPAGPALGAYEALVLSGALRLG